MAYRLRRREAPGVGLRRVAREQLDRAIAELSRPKEPDRAVHSVRKRIKRLRALLRLASPALAHDGRQAQQDLLRAAASRLAPARDAAVLRGAAERLANELEPESLKALRRAHRGELRRLPAELVRAAAELRRFRAGLSTWRLGEEAALLLFERLARTYRRGRRALEQARKEPTDEHLHEWRKRVKDLWYQATVLEALAAAPAAELLASLERLAELLGEDHDRAVLRARLGLRSGHPAVAGRAALQAEAFALGASVYRERPRRWRKHHGAAPREGGAAPAARREKRSVSRAAPRPTRSGR